MYDLAIIGGGPAGYVAAENAGAKGLNVVLFEKRELGGVCLNEGCIPTKTLLYSAKMYDHATGGKKYGITAENVAYEYKKIADRNKALLKNARNCNFADINQSFKREFCVAFFGLDFFYS
jgi:dihydrolipoamide dehydrogenase